MYLAWCIDNEGYCSWLEPQSDVSDREVAMAMQLQKFFDDSPRDISLLWGSRVPEYFADLESYVYGITPSLAKLDLFKGTTRTVREIKAAYAVDHPESQNAGDLTVCVKDAKWYSLLARLMFNNVPSDENNSLLSVRQPCPYHIEVPFFTIGTGDVSEAMANALFDGRVIIVGSRFRNTSDSVNSVVHGLLPGMHVHAMALDNLITSHSGYLQSPYQDTVLELFGLGRIDENDLHETFTMFIVALIAIIGQFTLNRRLIERANSIQTGVRLKSRPSHWLLYLMTMATIVLVVVLAVWIQVSLIKAAPMNWIGMIALAWSFFFFLLRDEIGDDLSKLFRNTPQLKRVGRPALERIGKIMRYLDMETIGFERSESVSTARSEKDRVVAIVYPEVDRDVLRQDKGAAAYQKTLTEHETSVESQEDFIQFTEEVRNEE